MLNSTVLAVALAEGGFTLLLAHPVLLRCLPGGLPGHMRNYYLAFDRELIQADAACARYDPEVTYTLRPGTCRFANREFDAEVRVNEFGVRDDERARSRLPSWSWWATPSRWAGASPAACPRRSRA